jgi:hypothetical protein
MTASVCCLLTGCSLLTEFDARRDAARPTRDIEEHDSSASPHGSGDASSSDGDPVDTPHTETADAAQDPAVEVAPDGGVRTNDAVQKAGAKPEVGKALDGGPDASGQRPGSRDLIDAISGERTDRTDRVCDCPGAVQGCARVGLGKSSCLERGLELFAGYSEDSVRALLECVLPAEQAYTDCVERRLSCRDVESSISLCSLEYDRATARCSSTSFQGLSLQNLCSR